ncbi:restriction endonuclease subunit S [Vibrio cincinnatiensis]
MGKVTSLQPILRFSGFNGDWSKKWLGSVCSIGDVDHWMPQTVSEGIPYLMTGDFVGINELDFANAKLISETDYGRLSRKIKPEYGDILFARYASVGAVRYVNTHHKFQISYSCAILKKPRNYDSQFLFYNIQSPEFQKKVELEINTGSQRNIGIDSLKKIEVFFPNNTVEQTQIGDFFQSLDQQIKLHQEKHNKLQQLKQAMLGKMFPKLGAKVPQVRFDGFSGNWVSKTLGIDVATVIGGGTPNTMDNRYWNGEIDWYSPTEIGFSPFAYSSVKKITRLGLKNSSAKILPKDKTIMFTSRAGIGDMAILKNEATTNQGFQSLVLNEGYDTYFIYSMGHLIKDYALQNASGSTFLEISGKTLGKMKVKIPSLTEQTKIGQYFQNLDNLIALQQQKIDKLKNIKQACLGKMFV